jgi:hypothetical protein
MIAQVRKRLGESRVERYCFSGIEQLDAIGQIRLPWARLGFDETMI